MRRTAQVWAVAAGASVFLTAACSTALPIPSVAAAAAFERFQSCNSLLDYVKAEATERVTAWGLGFEAVLQTAAEQAGANATSADGDTSFSGTNTQVEGVDEADVVKTNGEVIVTSTSGSVRVIDAASAEVIATIDSPALRDGSPELLLDGDDLVIMSTQWPQGHGGERTVIVRVDLTDPANPEIVGTTRIEGGYRSARMIDGTIRLALVTQPPGLVFTTAEDGSLSSEAEALEANKQVIADSTIDDWLPHQQSVDASGAGSAPVPLLSCTAIGRPATFSGFSTIAVITLDDEGDASVTSGAGVLAGGETIYASTDRMIVATSPWRTWAAVDFDSAGSEASSAQTDLHTFDISDPGATSYVASGRVDGWLLNQFAIDETDGVARVATTLSPPWSATPTSSSLVMLTESGDELVETGRVDGLGETEQIYAVRYLGPDVAAVVTFRQTDPLYLIDTSDPSAPAVLGELKIPGYSAYLHPLADGQLLGVGQDAGEDGQTTGLQASLFDITDLSAPTRIAQVAWPSTTSTVEWDHRAFLMWEDRIYLPAETYNWEADTTGEGKPQLGLVTLDLGDGTLTEGPRIDTSDVNDPWLGSVSRVLVVGDDLWAIGYTDAYRFDLETLEGGHVATL